MEGTTLRVHLETGDWKAVKYAANTTVQEVINLIGLKVNLPSVLHFGIYLSHSEPLLCQWLHPLRTITSIETMCNSKQQVFVTASWRYEFRVRFLPKNCVHLFAKDKQVFNYFHQQQCNGIVNGKFDDTLSENTLFQLGALEVVRKCAEMSQKKYNLDYFEKELGYHTILPDFLLKKHKPKDVKKFIAGACKDYEKLSPDECKLMLFKLMQESTELGLTSFNVQLEMISGWGVSVQLLIGPKSGMSRKENNTVSNVADFAQLRSVAIIPQTGKCKVEIKLSGYDTEILKVITENQTVAEELSSLLDGYYKLFVDPRSSLLLGDPASTARAGAVRAGRGAAIRASMHLPTRNDGGSMDDWESDPLAASFVDPAMQHHNGAGNVHYSQMASHPVPLSAIGRRQTEMSLHKSSSHMHIDRVGFVEENPLVDPMLPAANAEAIAKPTQFSSNSLPRGTPSLAHIRGATSMISLYSGTSPYDSNSGSKRNSQNVPQTHQLNAQQQSTHSSHNVPLGYNAQPADVSPRGAAAAIAAAVESVLEVVNNEDMTEDDYVVLDAAFDGDTIFRDQLTIGSTIGEGQFGSVNEGIWSREDGAKIPVAIKTLKNEATADIRKEFLAEATLMSKLNHPHIVKILGVSFSSPMLIVCELMPLGSLRQYLIDNKSNLNLKMLLGYNWQIVSAMSYLEHVRVVHRDIATRNILVATRHVVKLTDFGLSRVLANEDVYTASGGKMPIKWMAPESINFRYFNTATDVWSYGVCMWEIMNYGEKPFKEVQNQEVIVRLEEGLRLPWPNGCPESLYRVMLSCWEYEPERRPTFRQLYDRLMKVIAEERIEIQGLTTTHLKKSTSDAELRIQAARIADSFRYSGGPGSFDNNSNPHLQNSNRGMNSGMSFSSSSINSMGATPAPPKRGEGMSKNARLLQHQHSLPASHFNPQQQQQSHYPPPPLSPVTRNAIPPVPNHIVSRPGSTASAHKAQGSTTGSARPGGEASRASSLLGVPPSPTRRYSDPTADETNFDNASQLVTTPQRQTMDASFAKPQARNSPPQQQQQQQQQRVPQRALIQEQQSLDIDMPDHPPQYQAHHSRELSLTDAAAASAASSNSEPSSDSFVPPPPLIVKGQQRNSGIMTPDSQSFVSSPAPSNPPSAPSSASGNGPKRAPVYTTDNTSPAASIVATLATQQRRANFAQQSQTRLSTVLNDLDADVTEIMKQKKEEASKQLALDSTSGQAPTVSTASTSTISTSLSSNSSKSKARPVSSTFAQALLEAIDALPDIEDGDEEDGDEDEDEDEGEDEDKGKDDKGEQNDEQKGDQADLQSKHISVSGTEQGPEAAEEQREPKLNPNISAVLSNARLSLTSMDEVTKENMSALNSYSAEVSNMSSNNSSAALHPEDVKLQVKEILSALDDILLEEQQRNAQTKLAKLKEVYQDKIMLVMEGVVQLKDAVRLSQAPSTFVEIVHTIVKATGDCMDLVGPVIACLFDLSGGTQSSVADEAQQQLDLDVLMLKKELERVVEKTKKVMQYPTHSAMFQTEMLDAAFKVAVEAKSLCDRVTKF